MVSAIDLGTEPLETPRSPFAVPEEGIGLTDFARRFAQGGYGIVGSTAGMIDYATRGKVEGWRELSDWAQAGQEEQRAAMSPAMQRAQAAHVLPGNGPTIWDKDVSTSGAIAGAVVEALPSLISSMIPGFAVARAAKAAGAGFAAAGAAGTAAGGVAGGVQSGGDVFNQIIGEIKKTPDEQLQQESETYRGLRGMGMDEAGAKDMIARQSAGYKPLIMAAVTAFTSRYGVESMVAHRAAGEVGKGALRGIGIGVLGEASQEAIEGVSGELLAQQGSFDARGGAGNYDWQKALEAAASGALVGGITGGAVGGATHRRGVSVGAPVDADVDAALSPTPVPVAPVASVTPEVTTSEGLHAVVDQKTATPGHEVAALNENLKEVAGQSGVVVQTPVGDMTVSPSAITGLAPDEQAALGFVYDPELGENPDAGVQPDVVPAADVPAGPPALPRVPVVASPLAEAIGAEPLPTSPQPTPERAATPAPIVETAPIEAPGQPATVAPVEVAPVLAEATPAPAVAGKTRLEEVLDKAGATRVSPRDTKAQGVSTSGLLIAPDGKIYSLYATGQPTHSSHEAVRRAVTGQTETLVPGTVAVSVSEGSVGGSATASVTAGVATFPQATIDKLNQIARANGVPKLFAQATRTGFDFAGDKTGRSPPGYRPFNEVVTPAGKQSEPAPSGRVFEGGELVERKPKKVALKERVAELQAANPELSIGDAVKQATKEQSEKLVKKTRYNEPRMGKLKKAQIEAGATEVLPAKELAKKVRKEGLEGLAERVRAAQQAMPEPPTLADPPQKLRAYARELAEQSQIGDVSLANLPADVDPVLRLVKAAVQIGKGAGAAAQARDFLVNDLALRKGAGEAIKEYAQAQTTSGVSLNEDVGSTETGTGAVANTAESDVVDAITKRMRRSSTIQARTARDLKRARQSKPASAQEAQAVAATVGATVGQDRAGKFVVEKGRRKLTPPGKDAGTTKRETGQATAKTETEAAKALTVAREAENQDIRREYTDKEIQLLTEVGNDLEKELRAAGMWDEAKALPRRAEDDAAARELNKVLGEPRHETTTLGQILTPGKWHEDLTGLPRLMAVEMAGRLRKLAKDVPVHIVDTQRFIREWQKIHPGDERGMPEAFYNITTDEIIVRFDMLNPRVVIHEGTHAAYHRAIEDDPKVRAEIKKLMAAAEQQYVEEQRRDGKTGNIALPYAFDSEHEFVAEAFSNEKIQELLHRTPPTEITTQMPRGFSGWAQLIRNIKATLFGKGGPSESVLSQIVTVTARIDEAATKARGGGPMLALASRPSGSRIVNIQNYAQDKAEGGRMWWQRSGLKLGTLDQIERRMRGLFQTSNGDGITRIQEALQRQQAYVQGKVNEGHEWAQKFLEIKQRNPEEAQRAAEIMIDATMANVNLGPNADNSHLGKDAARYYQSKAQLARLQAAFASLKPETQNFILDSAAYYRDTQNQMVKGLIANVLNAFEPTLSVQAYSQLTTRAMNGTLTEEDAGIIDNDAVFKWLSESQGLRVVKGIYFPLMRHGDFVVRTTDKLGDLHGGKVVETDKHGNVVIEWRAATDKTARAAYKSFADNSANQITSVGKRRYLPDGTVVSEVDSRGQTHDVAYRARVQRRGVHFFDSASQAQRFIREEGSTFEKHDPAPLDRADMEARGDLTTQQFTALVASLDKQPIDASEKALLKTTLMQASVRLMSGNRVQQRSLPRRNVRGASEDMARNTLQYATAASNYLGKIRYMPEVRAAMRDMNELMAREPYSKDQQLRGQVMNELRARIDNNVVNIKESPQLVKDIMTLSFLDKLFSPAYSIINGMQPWMVTAPVLGGRYGALRAGAAIVRAYDTIGGLRAVGSGIYNTAVATKHVRAIGLDTTDIVGSIRSRLASETDGVGLTQMFDQLVERGLVDAQSGLEIAGAVSSGRGVWGTGLAKVDRIARQLPVAVEAVNRAVSAVAAYRLGRSAGMTEEQATVHAMDVVNETQGDYSAVNQPRFFNKPLLGAALQFKKYAQLMSALMLDMVQRARFEKGRERRVALKQLGGVFAVQIAMAGAMGLPGLELLKVGFMIAAALGVGDGWDEMDRRLRRLFDQALGKTAGELVTRGVISRAINVDLSGRVSLADMWTFGEPKSNDRQGAQAYLFNLVGGAPASLVLDWLEVARHAGEGEYADAFIKGMPIKFISDVAKAAKGRGNRDLTNIETVMQGIGLRSGRMAEEGFETGGKIAIGKKLEEERKQLNRSYLNAGSEGEKLRIKSRIIAHNERAKETNNTRQQVFIKSLDRIRGEKETKRRALQGD